MKFITSEGGASATFSGTAEDDTKFYALYPYQSGLTLNSSTGVISGVTIPYEQNPFPTSFDSKAAIAYATTTDASLTFHNACALLKISNNRENSVKITISCGGVLTGTFDLDTSTGALTVQSNQGKSSVSTQMVPPMTTIYFAIAPGTVEDLTVNCRDDSGKSGSKRKMGSTTFEAGKIYDLGKTKDWNLR